jgi:5S rRNA maturation endonuclease (ribonuclease M5)
LVVKEGREGRVLVTCHAGCEHAKICDSLGITVADLYPDPKKRMGEAQKVEEIYPYEDERGDVLYEVVRYHGKQFRQRRPDPTAPEGYLWNTRGVRRVLYRLPQVQAAIAKGETIYVVEGEKDVQAVKQVGGTATCNPGGAGRWRPEYAEMLRDATVTVVADRDEPGRKHARKVVQSLTGVASSVRLVEPAAGKDTRDHVEAGNSLDQLREVEPTRDPLQDDGPPLVRSLAEILKDPTVRQPPQPVAAHLAWAGRVTLLAAREKAGKSTLATAAAAAVSAGRAFLGEATQAGPVLWLGLEEHENDVANRLDNFEADAERIFLLLRLGETWDDLQAAIVQVEPVLLVIDTLAAFAQGDIDDASSAASWTRVMSHITRMARDTNVAILILHHARKSDDKYRDSTAIGANVDVIIEMKPDGDSPVRKLASKGRWLRNEISLELHDGEFQLLAGQETLEARVLDYVRDHPRCSKGAIRSGVRGKAPKIDAVLASLVNRGRLVNEGGEGRHAYVCSADEPSVSRVPLGNGGRDTPATPLPPLRPDAESVSQAVPPGFGEGTREKQAASEDHEQIGDAEEVQKFLEDGEERAAIMEEGAS